MSAIEDIEQRLVGPYSAEIGPEGDRVASIRLSEFRAALAEAWAQGRDDGLDDLGATQVAIDYGELTNPFEEGS